MAAQARTSARIVVGASRGLSVISPDMIGPMEFHDALRVARAKAAISQAELARRARTSQSRVSSYESGSVVPSASNQARLLAAARLHPSVALDRRRHDVVRLAGRHRLGNVRVFGSVARGDDTLDSDIDLLVTPEEGASLFDLAGFAQDVEDLLDCPVDVASDRGLTSESPISQEALSL